MILLTETTSPETSSSAPQPLLFRSRKAGPEAPSTLTMPSLKPSSPFRPSAAPDMLKRARGVDLLNNPNLVATDVVLSFKTALWLWMRADGWTNLVAVALSLTMPV
ncbi:hypothetical protein K1719_036009 [Acacia pycnantha]|nr:hypothetical protein K1719_036009 [Acacia pycnantha]